MKKFKNPVTQKKILRFKEIKQAYFSLWILIIIYLVSLGSEFVCNGTPLYVKFNGSSYFPVLKFYSENVFKGNGKKTRPNYKKMNKSKIFGENSGNYMIFAPVPFGPFESIDPKSIPVSDNVTVSFVPVPMIGTVNIKKDYSVARSYLFEFFAKKEEKEIKGHKITKYCHIPIGLKKEVDKRFANKKALSLSIKTECFDGRKILVSLSTFSPRKKSPKTVRLTFREIEPEELVSHKLVFNKDLVLIKKSSQIWNIVSEYDKKLVFDFLQRRLSAPVDTLRLTIENRLYKVSFTKEDIRFPFPPIAGHIMGIDGAGRDVFARILYGFRTSLSFGLMLVLCSMTIGIIAGAVQGYYGSIVDITGQRFIEIWSTLPFLYVMILIGSLLGRSFLLLLFCYGLFNWIGISYYIRAEFLRLRKQPFVEAAKCMGISNSKIIFKHILPNAMVPVITFSPFMLVGAIGSLAALDYLGFGLPPPTPSWGELLFQAQQYRWAWWLILYPSTALFVVMLLCIFVGDGIRNAFDPKRYSRLR